MKKITTFLSILMLFSLMSCVIKTSPSIPDDSLSKDAKLQICPDEMIDNQMPQVIFDDVSLESQNNVKTQFYILDGKRREIEEFDEGWVKENCNVKTQTVY